MKKKVIIIGMISILTLCVFFFVGSRGFVSSIRKQRTCEWANIDNIELHAHVDIPKVTTYDCYYEKGTNTKKAFFTIDNNNFDLDRYIKINKLKKLSSLKELECDGFLNLGKDSLSISDLYYRKSHIAAEHYDVLFDKTTGRLWVTIKYKD